MFHSINCCYTHKTLPSLATNTFHYKHSVSIHAPGEFSQIASWIIVIGNKEKSQLIIVYKLNQTQAEGSHDVHLGQLQNNNSKYTG